MENRFAIINTTRGRVPRVSFKRIKNTVLGKQYQLSLVFIGEKKSQALNRMYRTKNKPTNILSFPLAKGVGEIFIALPTARREAQKRGTSFSSYAGYLFIHGLLHLKGLTHGSRMEKEEKRLCARFSIELSL